MTMVVQATAAATEAYELIVPVQRFPTLRGVSIKSVGAANAAVDNTITGTTSLENIMVASRKEFRLCQS